MALSELSLGKRGVGCKWIFKAEHDAEGTKLKDTLRSMEKTYDEA